MRVTSAVKAPRKVELASTKPVVEVRDPEEAKSFPVSGSVHHSSATTPAKVAEEFVAPGAQSNAEVRAELGHMHAIESAARAQAHATVATVPGGDSVGGNGTIPIPAGIPEVVQRVIAGANAITDFPYVYGGGHASFVSNSYDCSGSVSYALAAGGLLSAPETSGTLESWGEPGPGKWITIYANAGHVYMYVNVGGRWMRFDTVGSLRPLRLALAAGNPLQRGVRRSPPAGILGTWRANIATPRPTQPVGDARPVSDAAPRCSSPW